MNRSDFSRVAGQRCSSSSTTAPTVAGQGLPTGPRAPCLPAASMALAFHPCWPYPLPKDTLHHSAPPSPARVPKGQRAGDARVLCEVSSLLSSTRGSFLTKKQDQAARKIMRFLRRCRHRCCDLALPPPPSHLPIGRCPLTPSLSLGRMRELKQNQELEGLPQPGLAT